MNVAWLAFLLGMAPSLFGDTVYFREGGSINGDLQSLQNGKVSIDARFASGTRTVVYSLADVDRINFNTEYFNQNAPPKDFGIGSSNAIAKSSNSTTADSSNVDVVIMRGKPRKSCKLESIDRQLVHCGGDIRRQPDLLGIIVAPR